MFFSTFYKPKIIELVSQNGYGIMKLNLEYLYQFNKERYRYYSSLALNEKTDLLVAEYSNCYLLPARAGTPLFGIGGAVDDNFNEIRDSFILHGKNDSVYFGGKYEFTNNDIELLKGEYVYLGYIRNHWGHFLVDFCTRLWFFKHAKDQKFIFIVDEKRTFSFIPQIKRFIELLGIDPLNIIFCNHILKIEKLLIPQQAYQTNKYVSKEYSNIFDVVRSNILPTSNYKKFDKIYYSRKNFYKAKGTELNLELMDNFFEKNNFNIIYPETLSLDDQIAYINDSKELAMISGTLIHNLVFLNSSLANKTIYIINKTYIVNIMALDTLKIMNISPIMIDCYYSKYPVSLGLGPFMLCPSICLHKVIKEKGLKSYDPLFDSDDYLIETISKYELVYQKINFINSQIKLLNSSSDAWNYFDVNNLYMWLNYCSRYELYDKKIYELFQSGKEITNSLLEVEKEPISNNKLQMIMSDNYLLYSVHISNFGWTHFSLDSNYAGFLNLNRRIEAFIIKSDFDIQYRCYYDDNGWSNLCQRNKICGSTGKSKRIQGICIESNDEYILFEYRVYLFKRGWSNFVRKNIEIYSNDGFCALEIRLLNK